MVAVLWGVVMVAAVDVVVVVVAFVDHMKVEDLFEVAVGHG